MYPPESFQCIGKKKMFHSSETNGWKLLLNEDFKSGNRVFSSSHGHQTVFYDFAKERVGVIEFGGDGHHDGYEEITSDTIPIDPSYDMFKVIFDVYVVEMKDMQLCLDRNHIADGLEIWVQLKCWDEADLKIDDWKYMSEEFEANEVESLKIRLKTGGNVLVNTVDVLGSVHE